MFWAAFLLWAISGFVAQLLPTWGMWAWLIAGITLLIAQFWIRCTRCKAHIPSVMGVGLSKWANPINFCPFCGINLDEPTGP